MTVSTNVPRERWNQPHSVDEALLEATRIGTMSVGGVVPATVVGAHGAHAGVLSTIHHSHERFRYGERHLVRTLPGGGVLSSFTGEGVAS